MGERLSSHTYGFSVLKDFVKKSFFIQKTLTGGEGFKKYCLLRLCLSFNTASTDFNAFSTNNCILEVWE